MGETSSLGAALWAIKGAGTLSALQDIESMVPIGDLCGPEPKTVEVYIEIYKVYKDLYAAASPLFPRIVHLQEENG